MHKVNHQPKIITLLHRLATYLSSYNYPLQKLAEALGTHARNLAEDLPTAAAGLVDVSALLGLLALVDELGPATNESCEHEFGCDWEAEKAVSTRT